MVQLYGAGTTDFSVRGIELFPSEADVQYQDNGQYHVDFVMPVRDVETIQIDYGMIVRCTVPRQEIAAISLGEVSYYTVNTADTPLYSQLPSRTKRKYAEWQALRSYMQGDKVTYYLSKTEYKNYQCRTGHGGLSVPPPDSNLWTEISSWQNNAGTVIATLASGTALMKTADFSDDYMEVATTDGKQGYIEISKATATGSSGERTVPAFTITEQNFTVTEIRKEQNGRSLRIHAEHVSYQLERTMLGDCSVVDVTPATAMLFIAGAMQESYGGKILTNLNDGSITGDWSWKNAQSAILDPSSGILKVTGGRLIRDNLDVYLIDNPDGTPSYEVVYGGNLKDVHWDGDVGGIVTRVYPIAQNEDGSTLMLPEKYIDTVRTVPFVRPEVLKTGLKVGQTEEASDGTETVLTEADVLSRMRAMAWERFTLDEADKAQVTLELDWLHMPDTEEYRQYQALKNAAPGDWVYVKDGPMGVTTVIQMTGYTWDPVKLRYKKAVFGKQTVTASVASYDIQSSAITARMLARGSVGSDAIMANSVTAREILANSITAEQIASRSITTELLMAGAVTANEITAGAVTAEKIAALAITTDKLAANAITAEKIAALAITTDKLAANAVTAGKIAALAIQTQHLGAGSVTAEKVAAGAVVAEKIAAGAVVAEKIAAGAVSTEKLAANAVTAAKIDAGAVTAEKIAAGAVNADKISATDISAINAKLGTAAIATAIVESADISYAQVKDLNAQSAYFGQAVIQDGLANKLYIPRLSVGYAQMVGATIGDLVIQATNGNYYAIDVDMSGNVTATQRTVTAGEIASGHTSDGRTIYMGTDILAEDLNTNNIYASHALMDQITANIINVDKLFAREATISKINALDLSSNTYIRSTIGNWQSGSTITQTIDSLDSRISGLGYGTVYMQPNEPNHSNLVSGDIWVQTMTDGSWQEIYNSFASWNEIYNTVSTWQVLGSIPIMWVWDGRRFQQMYDALLPTTMETEIQQLWDQISLRATKASVDLLSGEVTEFSAELSVMADEIESAVSTVNAKAASFVMWNDPRNAYSVSLGDVWVKRDENFCDGSTWQDVYDNFASWQALYSSHTAWADMLGDRTYVWNGSEWIETSNRAEEIYQRTLIDQTSTSVSILAETTATIEGELYSLNANLTVANDRITAEVNRATSAEGGKIDKTSQYQTADAIVSEAVSEAVTQAGTAASGAYIAKTTQYQDASSIVSEAVRQADSSAGSTYIAKTTSYQTADSIVSEAVRQSASAASGTYIAKTSQYQSADQIVSEAVRVAATNASGAYLAKTTSYQTADAIVSQAVSVAGSNAAAAYIAKDSNYGTVDAIIAEAEALADNAATTAKGASIAKTQTLQTADAIVNTAVAQAEASAGETYIAKTTSYQTADAIVNEAVRQSGSAASSAYIAKTTSYQTADSIVTEAVRQSASSASGTYIAKTSTYQTADSIYSAATGYVDGQLTSYSTRTQTQTMIADYVTDNAYQLVSGITITAAGVSVSGSQYVIIASGGYFQVTTGTFGIDTESSTYVIWSGAAAAATSPFRVKKDGTVYLTKLIAVGENGSETEVNLRTAGLWKLNYQTVKSWSTNSITLSNNTVVNFNTAAAAGLVIDVENNEVRREYNSPVKAISISADIAYNSSTHKYTATAKAGNTAMDNEESGTEAYSAGVTAGGTAAGVVIDTENNEVRRELNTATKAISISAAIAYNSITHKYTATAKAGNTAMDTEESGTDAYDDGVTDGIADYYGSDYWEGASADNDWVIKVPNSTNTGSEVWSNSGIAAARSNASGAAWGSAVSGSSSGRTNNVITSVIPTSGIGNFGTYTYTITATCGLSGQNQVTCAAKVNGTNVGGGETIQLQVNGLTPYSKAGQLAYQYVEGQYVSFTIPSDCKTGTPTIGLATS